MSQPDFEAARAYIEARLCDELPSDLYYHSPNHTLHDVLPAVEMLAAMEGVGGEDLLLLRTAALYHDAGYLIQHSQNEAIAVQLVEKILPTFAYTPDQITAIGQLIMATQLPQQPENLLEAILCDADLNGLARKDFFLLSHSLRLELAAYGSPLSVRNWYMLQIEFLSQHHYHTPAAHALYDSPKQDNLNELLNVLGGLKGL